MKKIIALGLMLGLVAISGVNAEECLNKNGQKANDANLLSKNKAVRIAYEHAGVKADEVAICQAKFEDSVTPTYEVEFIVGGTEYEFDIDAITGAIIAMDGAPALVQNNNNGGFIGVKQAEFIAFNNIGIKPGTSVEKLNIDLGRFEGVIVYNVKVAYNGHEYDYKLDAVTGKVLKAE